METTDHSNVAVCWVQFLDDSGNITVSCSRFPRPRHFYNQIFGLERLLPQRFQGCFMRDWDHDETRAVDVVMGAFLLVRRHVFEALGGFDERFFVYYEEVDFLNAVQRAGWQSYYLAASQVIHKGGGCSSQAKAARLFYSLRSRILYCHKHFSWWSATCVTLTTLLLEPFARITYAIMRGRLSEIGDTGKAYARLWGWLAHSLLTAVHRPIENTQTRSASPS